jgi:sporadic carbohydrate cluster 2OG-Fe(II) oxygenase
MNLDNFIDSEEQKINDQFLDKGYIIFPLDVKNGSVVDKMRDEIFHFSKEYLKLDTKIDIEDFFNHTEKYLKINQINDLKLKLIGLTSKNGKYHSDLYHSAKKYLDMIVGNEVCMQRSLNISIQLPLDESALLPLHTDVWSGNSPYEVVFWLPLVDCYKTKSMYVLPLKPSREAFLNFSKYEKMDAENLYKALEKDMIFLEVPKNHGVIFSHSILHGNRLNTESETRWTYNIRFKSVFSPYGTKGLGESFIPVTLRPATRIGYANIIPKMSI